MVDTGELPAVELLDALGLEEAEAVGTRRDAASGLLARSIRIPEPNGAALPPGGPEILHNELGPTREFDLVYDDKGWLLAVFPLLSAEARQRAQPKGLYFDLTPYYFRLPQIGDPSAEQQWLSFAEEWKANQEALAAFKESEGVPREIQRFSDQGQQPYVYAELGPNGEPLIFQFDLGELLVRDTLVPGRRAQLERLFADVPDRPRVIFPVFPTVFSPGSPGHFEAGLPYFETVWQAATDQALGDGDRSLIVGVGSGIDAWLVWEATKQPVYALGINPLEVANARAFAQAAGFPLEALIHDNVVSPEGRAAFGDLAFQLVCCYAPFYTSDPPAQPTVPAEGKAKTLSQYWVGDTGEFIERLALGLTQILDPERGVAVIWNRTSGGYIERLFSSFGLDLRYVVVSDEDVDPEEEGDDVVYVLRLEENRSSGRP